jgi:hypothetical protein
MFMVIAAIRSIPLWINAINSASDGRFDDSIAYISRIEKLRKLAPEEVALLALSYLKIDNPTKANAVIEKFRERETWRRLAGVNRRYMELYIERLRAIAQNESYESISLITNQIRVLKGVSERLSRIFIIR